MTSKSPANPAETPLFTWEGSTAPTRTISDNPPLFGLAEIPIRPTENN